MQTQRGKFQKQKSDLKGGHHHRKLRTQKLRSRLLRTQSSKVLPLKPGPGQYTAMHATPTARDFFLTNFYLSSPFTSIFSTTSHEFFLCWLWLTPVLALACRIKQVTLLIVRIDAGTCVGCPQNVNRFQDKCYCFSGLVFRNCGYELISWYFEHSQPLGIISGLNVIWVVV